MRLFIALNLPDEERERLHAAAAPLREAGLPVRWLDPESIHLTLKFLGEVRPEDVPRVESTLYAAAKQAPFELPLRGFGAFPTIRRPQVIWAGADATPQLRFLKHDVEWGFAALGFEREDRAFQPHITIGRVRPDARAGDFRGLQDLLSGMDYEAVLACESVDLMRSDLSPRGARYERIASAPLGSPAGAADAKGAGPAPGGR